MPTINACEVLNSKHEHKRSLSDHPLVNQIWDTREQKAVSRATLFQNAANTRYVFIGETHDNESHHFIQRELLNVLLAEGKHPALAMEQFDIEHQSMINHALLTANRSSESIAEAGQFNHKGWNWSLYEPLVATAAQANRPIVALNLSRKSAREIMTQGPEAVLGDTRVAQLALHSTWNSTREDALQKEIVMGHCGHVPTGLLPKLTLAQRARDAFMADALLNVDSTNVVAVVGREHARKDIGAPIYLAMRTPSASILSIGLIEIENERDKASDYFERNIAQRYDFVWFTHPAMREDPCKGFSLPAAPSSGRGK
ncbi:MAG TPA: ChaN family lipoprotein [Burkholderiales bacterium]|nr:ChaN family lipoprotein [Burkholderiales bacterium]